MTNKVTIVLNVHNRHSYLKRLLDYYRAPGLTILIADSSESPYVLDNSYGDQVKYIHFPGVSYPQKIELALAQVATPYVALSADDDFLVPEGLSAVIDFLEKNADHTVAQGKVIKYYKDSLKDIIRYDFIYNGDHSLSFPSAAQRIEKMFTPYKTLFCAVHRTKTLQFIFKDAGKSIGDLYLNEYLVSIGALLMGKSKDVDALYQVREYSESSDGNMVDNLDRTMHEKKYAGVYADFLQHLQNKIKALPENERAGLDKTLEESLNGYAAELVKFRTKPVSLLKSGGKIIQSIPLIGDAFIRRRRVKKSNADVQKKLTPAESDQLKKIAAFLKKNS